MPKRLELTGKKFGRLTVIQLSNFNDRRKSRWICECSCGNVTQVVGHNLSGGHSKSCGCLRQESVKRSCTTHNMTRKKTWNIWCNMKQRCNNRNNNNYNRYGLRGIKICRRWDKFENFYADLGDRPKGKTLDRKDNNKGYNKSNCRWADKHEQANNTVTNVFININGDSKTVAQWARVYKINVGTVWSRIRRGWNPKQAILTPPRKKDSLGQV